MKKEGQRRKSLSRSKSKRDEALTAAAAADSGAAAPAAAGAASEEPTLRHATGGAAAATETEEEQQLICRSTTDKSTTDRLNPSSTSIEIPAVQGYQESATDPKSSNFLLKSNVAFRFNCGLHFGVRVLTLV